MAQSPAKDTAALAVELLAIVPKILRRIHGDVPLEYETANVDPMLQEVSELRATPGQLSLLRVLIEHERCTMQELAEHLAVAPSTATAMVKRLFVQGYVERQRDDSDWRTVRVKATERGYQVFSVFDRARQDVLRRRLEMLSIEERKSLVAALPALHRLIEIGL